MYADSIISIQIAFILRNCSKTGWKFLSRTVCHVAWDHSSIFLSILWLYLMQNLGIHLPQYDSSDLSEQSYLKSHFWILATHWPLDLQTNSLSVQLCGGNVTGTEVSGGAGRSTGKLPGNDRQVSFCRFFHLFEDFTQVLLSMLHIQHYKEYVIVFANLLHFFMWAYRLESWS